MGRSASRHRQRRSRQGGLILGVLVLAGLALLSIRVGTQTISLAVAWDAVTRFDPNNSEHLLLRHLRIPRTLVAILVGSALGIAGTVMQALTRNPLADPGLLGVNAGAAVAIVAAIAFLGVSDVAGYLGFGLAGAALAGIAVCLLGGVGQGFQPVRLVLAGAALSVVLLALTQIITVNSDEVVFDQFRHWAVGSLQGRGQQILMPLCLLVAAGLGMAATLARALDAVALGHDLGKALGAHPAAVWIVASIAIVILSGAATAAAGPISFIGLTAPHVARFMAGADHRWTMPYAMVVSAVLMVAADSLGRLIAHPDEIGVGIMVALIGAPCFVVLARRRRVVQL